MADRANLPDLSNIVVTQVNIDQLYRILLDYQNRIISLEERVNILEKKNGN